VFILYLTAFMRDGELYFGNDLYARDADLVHATERGALPDTRTRAALDRLAQLANR
jgi:murein L,D-transpeptidase YcbB/YkuD